ncbi:MAG: hypothetical protein UR80_C0005G0004 [Parcubacteria group bacterium GW2011_GWB1_35_5]|uniref:Cell division protein FtsL n=1 Tax=Candidatus Zambryskibacteria bacterium RIFCSPLOWO2_01_FULL_35_19 TaxID=1802757 RepID=A0A1G2U148_9BACT|nr:MAG: hypothetical protein UR80_C0005G0004 [Parcubacteria group bacterium GW2011_GWB1_35_5]OHA86240.1 MAG: hypothetical protein A2726_00350 [Candidatus Zambryskibacteria bacterium RIFCSPHIGHO2_01_FULL_35_32]OHB02650.1 MAG: hypothetical protein A3A90_01840 [Candidatus Zambryskibacteria bacterium RIFCSPLOWO2_01_FULL_35_19]
MRGIKTKSKIRWRRAAIFVALFIIFIILLNSVNRVYKKKKEVEKALTQMQSEMVALEDRNEFLKNSLEKLKTKEGVEFEIRKKLNVAEVGESVAIIVEGEEVPNTPKLEVSTWQKIKDFFGGLFE